jgi:hypothetical protein
MRAIYLVTLPDRLLPAKTRAFIDFLWQRNRPERMVRRPGGARSGSSATLRAQKRRGK